MSLLRIDLSKHIREKHRLWMRDSVELYRTAGLSQSETTHDILYALLNALISGCRTSNLTKEQTLDMLYDWIETEEEEHGQAIN
jgi:hypothetical protein